MNINLTEVIIIAIALLAAFSVPLVIALFRRQHKLPLEIKPEDLKEAEQLFLQQSYALAMIKAFMALEVALRFRLNLKDGKMLDLIDLAATKKFLNRDLQNRAHRLRKIRNKLIHETGNKPERDEAGKFLQDARIVINRLGFRVDE